MEEIKATFIRENQRWDETIIATCRSDGGKLIKVKTDAEKDELAAGLAYSFCGRWKNHYRYGRQFIAQSFVKIQPHDEAGIIAYLQQAPGVGRKTAQVLWKRWGGEAVQTLRTDPAIAASAAKDAGVKQFGLSKAEKAAAWLDQEQALEDATIDCMNLLAGKGLPRKTLKRALKKWGNRASQIIRRNPYNLLRFPGCGFSKVDTIYLELGGDPARLKRQALCIWNGIVRETGGNSWYGPRYVTDVLAEKLGGATLRPVDALKLGRRGHILSTYRDKGGVLWITESGRSQAENDVAELAARFLAAPSGWPEISGLDVSDHQREELARALCAPISLFGGSPGTGKTYSAARLISALIKVHGQDDVAVIAPTGKAAVRITEALEEYGIGIRARTIHSFLGVLNVSEDLGGGWAFDHDEYNPVEQRFIVVDESSMIDTALMASLLRALRPDGHLLLVGDLQQLPPVGHGAPLRDLLAAGVPRGDLTEIRRNSGAIVSTCAQIRDEQPFTLPRQLAPPEQNLMLKDTRSSEESAELIIRLICKIRDRGLQDPVWETQVIVAVNEKSPLSRKELNRILQAELNGRNRSPSKFWPDDKIVCLKNQFLPALEDAMDDLDDDFEGFVQEPEDGGQRKIYVANGELGRVVEEFPNKLILEFPSPRRVVLVPKGEGGVDSFDLGYAISCHKSQGSEWPVVIVALDDYYGARMVCDRSWLYTAISRAKGVCILVGQESTARAMCSRQKIHDRKTLLVERIEKEAACLAERLAAGGNGNGNGGMTETDAPESPEENEEEKIRNAHTGAVHAGC